MKLKSCRICLAIGVKMTSLGGDPAVKGFIEKIFKSEGFHQDLHVLHYSCLECSALLQKCYKFIQKALTAQKAMYDIIKTQNKVTLPALHNINRHALGLNSTLSYHRAEINFNFQDNEDIPLEDEVEITVNLSEPETCDSKVKIKYENEMAPTNGLDDDTSYIGMVYEYVPPVKREKNDESDANSSDRHKNLLEMRRIKRKLVRKSAEVSIKNIIKDKTRKKKIVFKNIGSEEDSSADEIPKITTQKEEERKQNKKQSDDDYDPTDISSEESESPYDSYDEQGKRMKKPQEDPFNRIYPMKCDDCDYEIERRKMHFRHYLFCHPDVRYPYLRVKKFVCQFCGAKKATDHRLKEHEMTHSNKKEIKCPVCDMKFFNMTRMQAHLRRIHRRKQLYCDYCNKGMKTRSELVLHIRTHTGEKPFKCHICGHGFAHRGNVRIHIRNVHQKSTGTVSQKKTRTNKRRPKPKRKSKTQAEG